MARLEIPIKVDIYKIKELIDKLKNLQTYKLCAGDEMTLVDRDEVVEIITDHVKAEVSPPDQRWIPCSKHMPKTEEIVLVTCEHLDIYGKPHWYVCKAFHVDRYTMRSDADWWDEGCDEYREEDDQYYVLEGWYEYIHNWGDYSAVRITEDKVIAWMPLPEPAKIEVGGHE